MARIAENPDVRRRKLIEAAGRLVEAGGANGLSMRALAADTGTSPMSVYELFGSKDGLLIALLQDRQRAFVRRLSSDAQGSGLEKFFNMVEMSGPAISENFNFYQAAFFQYYSPAGKEIRDLFTKERRAVIKSMLIEIEFHRFTSKMTVDVLASYMDTVYNGSLFDWLVCQGSEEQFVRQFGLGCALALKAIVREDCHAFLDEQINQYSS